MHFAALQKTNKHLAAMIICILYYILQGFLLKLMLC